MGKLVSVTTGRSTLVEVEGADFVFVLTGNQGPQGPQQVFYDEPDPPPVGYPSINMKPVAGVPGLLDLQGSTGQ